MGQNQAIGSSRGGLKTKIVALLDALGNLSRFVLLPGQRHDSIVVEPLIMRKLKNRLWSVALVAQIEVIKAPQVQLTAQLQSINERPTSRLAPSRPLRRRRIRGPWRPSAPGGSFAPRVQELRGVPARPGSPRGPSAVQSPAAARFGSFLADLRGSGTARALHKSLC